MKEYYLNTTLGPAEHEGLVRALAALPADVRREVVSAAERAVNQGRTGAWELWDSARGVVSLGGNALEDCDRLYDGT